MTGARGVGLTVGSVSRMTPGAREETKLAAGAPAAELPGAARGTVEEEEPPPPPPDRLEFQAAQGPRPGPKEESV